MSLSNRRTVLCAGAALAFTTACQMSPVYGPDTASAKLEGQIFIPEPSTRETYLVTRRLETRLGRADPAPMTLTFTVSHGLTGLGTTATGGTTRYHRTGSLSFALKNTESGSLIESGTLSNFTGYSATGNTVATLAAERDSIERLMTILSDQLVDRLLVIDPEKLP